MGGIIRALGEFCLEIGQDQYQPNQRWMRDMLVGMAVGRSPMLSEIGRALEEEDEDGNPRRLIHTEKRLSKGLNSDRFDDEAIRTRHLEQVARWTLKGKGEGIVVAVDYTDISKPWANTKHGMEGVGVCWNGSDHEKGVGYPVVQIEADMGDAQVPVLIHPFSYDEKDFVEGSQANIFLAQMKIAAPTIGPRAWWTMDRGFDNIRYFDGFDELNLRWIVRLQHKVKNERSLFTADGRLLPIRDLAEQTERTYTLRVKAGKKRTKKKGQNFIELQIGAMPVWLSDMKNDASPVGPQRTLISVWGFGKEPIVTLVSEALTEKEAILEAAKAYGRRWKCEEETRAMKDSRGWGVDLEDVRALKLRGIRRLAALIALLYVFLASVRGMDGALVKKLLALVQCFGACPPDPLYRIFRGLGELLRRAGRGRWEEEGKG